MFEQNQGSDKWRFHFLEKLHNELCLAAYLNEIMVLIGNIFFAILRRI